MMGQRVNALGVRLFSQRNQGTGATFAMMGVPRFWEIIENARQLAQTRERAPADSLSTMHLQALAETLRALPPKAILGFQMRFDDYLQRAYRADLRAAASILGGAKDFADFRACLISMGMEKYFRVIAQPDYLAEVLEPSDVPTLRTSGFQQVAARIYRDVTGADIPHQHGNGIASGKPVGAPIDHANVAELRRRFPKLVAKFPPKVGEPGA